MISGCKYRKVTVYQNPDTQYEARIAYRLLYKVSVILAGLLCLAISLSACEAKSTPFRPSSGVLRVTPSAQTSPTPISTVQAINTPPPTNTPVCTNSLTLLESVSIPDGMLVRPGELVDKRWLVQNSGSCNWDVHYQLRSIPGIGLNAAEKQALFPARSGAKATIRIQFTAPSEPGSYQGTWQAYDPQDQPFGDLLTLLIEVNSGVP